MEISKMAYRTEYYSNGLNSYMVEYFDISTGMIEREKISIYKNGTVTADDVGEFYKDKDVVILLFRDVRRVKRG